jgi:hypothetical protein
MSVKKMWFQKERKPEMVKQGFYAVCSESTSWEQKVFVSVPEGMTDKQLEALGSVLLENEDEIQDLGFFGRYEEKDGRDIEIHQGDLGDESDDSLPCRLNDDGEWEIGGIHWKIGDETGPHADDGTQEEYVALRLTFERLVPVEGYVDVWVPARVVENVDCGTRLADTLEDAVLERDSVKWNDRVDLRRAIRSPAMESVEQIAESADESPALRACLRPNGRWKIRVVSSDELKDDDED